MREAVLNAGLFDASEEAYRKTANDLLRSPDRPTPRRILTTASFNMISRLIAGKELKQWGDDILEMFAIAYAFVASEAWESLDPEAAVRLMDDGLVGVKRQREATGQEPISLDDLDNRVTITTLGLVGKHPDFGPMREYLYALPSFRRIDALLDLYRLAGVAMTKVKSKHLERLGEVQLLGWRFGVALGLLDLLGEIPASL